LLLGAFVLAWALACVFSLRYSGVAGFTTTASGEVTNLRPDGPADRAGLRIGDRLLGYRAPGSAGLRPLGPVPAGETRVLGVQRDDATMELTVRFVERSGAALWRPLAYIALGVGLLVISGFARRQRPGRLTGILFLAGSGIGLACMGEPELGDSAWRAAIMAIRNAVVLAGLGAMVQFTLEYVRRGRRANWVYLPLGAYWLVLDWRLLAPGATALASVSGVLGGALLVLSLSVVLVTLSRGWIRGRNSNDPPGIGLAFSATVGGLALLLAAAALQQAGGFTGLVDIVGALALLGVMFAWARVATRT
jgi:hypothetical protein